ncbi:MAG: PIN domain nuclease [Anaerolineae bacterium]|nr:MAG: PIN domain nuclease [Anaerolineae bacterium]
MTLLIDSSVWIDYFNGVQTSQTDFLDNSFGRREIVVGDLILIEVLQGFSREEDFEQAREALLKFPLLDMVGAEPALKSAGNFRRLRSRGVTVRKTIDSLIATVCIEHDLELLHTDRDFDPFEEHLGLKVLHPENAN